MLVGSRFSNGLTKNESGTLKGALEINSTNPSHDFKVIWKSIWKGNLDVCKEMLKGLRTTVVAYHVQGFFFTILA